MNQKFFWTTQEALEASLTNLEVVKVGYPKFYSLYKYNAKTHSLTWMYHGDDQLFKDTKQYTKEELQAIQTLIKIGRKDIEEGRFYTADEMMQYMEELSKNNPYKS